MKKLVVVLLIFMLFLTSCGKLGDNPITDSLENLWGNMGDGNSWFDDSAVNQPEDNQPEDNQPEDSHTEHTYQSTITYPTCVAVGYTTYTCTCGDSYISNEVVALGHDYKSVANVPTCELGGYTIYTCSVCNDSYEADQTPALGHSYKTTVTAATCVNGGYTTYTCSVPLHQFFGTHRHHFFPCLILWHIKRNAVLGQTFLQFL